MLIQRSTKKKNTESFVKECILKNNSYDYSLVEYKNNKTKVKIICEKHGVFEQTPNNHLKGQDCPDCSDKHFKLKSNDEIINDFILLNGDKYDYSLVDYKGNKTKVEIVCKKHGSFFQTPNNHLKGQDCPDCKKITTEIFINRANEVHNKKYDYSLVEYINMTEKVIINCLKHGLFKQATRSHLNGVGCPKCQESKGEREIRKILEMYNIEYLNQHSFIDCFYKRELKFDFYLPNLNICIEYDGEQHFKPIDFYGGMKNFKIQKERDSIKSNYCKYNNIKLLRISYKDDIKNKMRDVYY